MRTRCGRRKQCANVNNFGVRLVPPPHGLGVQGLHHTGALLGLLVVLRLTWTQWVRNVTRGSDHTSSAPHTGRVA